DPRGLGYRTAQPCPAHTCPGDPQFALKAALVAPVGPPCASTSSGYFRPAWYPTGLSRMPSTGVPSVLFHVITSVSPNAMPASCGLRSVSFLGDAKVRSLTYTSAGASGEPNV